MPKYRIRLSKFLSFILRHDPAKYDLDLDKHGYTATEKVLEVLQKRFTHFKEEDLLDLVKADPKGRFEIKGDKIRATYGHSVEVVPEAESTLPPEVLYHGTSEESVERILSEGLKPMDRQFVHLSMTKKDAYMVGSRHTHEPIVLEILARDAAESGIKFYKEGKLFLAKEVPAEYIRAKAE